MAGEYDLKPNFPIASVADLIANRNVKENAMRQQQYQNLIQGIGLFGQGVQSLVDKRNQMAQAAAQADILMRKPEFVQTMAPDTRPVASVAAARGPVTLGQTASPDANGNPIPNAMPSNLDALRQKLAVALQGSKPDTFLKMVEPQTVQETVYQKDAQGNTIGTQTRIVPKGSKFTVVGPQPVPPPKTGTPMSDDRANLKIVEDFNNNPQVKRQQQSIDGAAAVRDLATSGNPIAAAAIPTYMARASGEVGALSEADKAPFGGTRQILDKLEASFTQLSKGQLTPENQQFLLDLSDIMERNAINNLDRKGREMSKQLAKALKRDDRDIFSMLRPNSQFEEKKTTDTKQTGQQVTTPRGVSYTVSN